MWAVSTVRFHSILLLFCLGLVCQDVAVSGPFANKKPAYVGTTAGWINQKETLTTKHIHAIVQVSASQGGVVALVHALVSTWTANLLIVSPLFRGSNPYPCGSLTYRNAFRFSVVGLIPFLLLCQA